MKTWNTDRLAILLIGALSLTSFAAPKTDPLPSWTDGTTKTAILQFVQDVATEGSSNYVPPQERIATFDNDGTLWCEQPVPQMEFITYQIFQMAPQHPEWKTTEPYKSILGGDKNYLINDFSNNGGREFMKLAVATHTGVSMQEFDQRVQAFFADTQHPRFKHGYDKTIYQPMVELLKYLRANGFKTYICSGGGLDFMRVISEEAYGILPEQVIGSFAQNTFEQVDGKWELIKGASQLFNNDGLAKPVGIARQIGRIPIFVAGNIRTGGDIGQLTYGQSNPLPNFQLLINHDDDVREYAYAEKDNASLNAAKESGWQVVSMKQDWNTIFAFEPSDEK